MKLSKNPPSGGFFMFSVAENLPTVFSAGSDKTERRVPPSSPNQPRYSAASPEQGVLGSDKEQRMVAS